jgi:16S rRNA G966 N2-methylase RsmD
MLNSGKYSEIDINLAIRQITGIQKMKNKVPDFLKVENILYPTKLSLEQSSSQDTAIYKSKLFQGETFIDLTGGFGIDFYFISKGFNKNIYIEKSEELCQLAGHNFKLLKINQFKIIHDNSVNIFDQLDYADLIYADPHRRNDSGKKTVFIEDCEPNIAEIIDKLILKADKLMIKLSPMLDINLAIRDLKYVNEVHVISVENDCKEILFILCRKPGIDDILIKTVNFIKSSEQHFSFNLKTESESIPVYASDIEAYIYEPNVAVLKSGAFKSISASFNLKKLHPNTHLYTSNELIRDFPGRIFKTIQFFENNKSSLKELKNKYSQANITFRNYPLTVSDFRSKTGIKDGGRFYIFGCQIYNGKYILIVCEKVN